MHVCECVVCMLYVYVCVDTHGVYTVCVRECEVCILVYVYSVWYMYVCAVCGVHMMWMWVYDVCGLCVVCIYKWMYVCILCVYLCMWCM